jgi:predicted ATPase
VKAYQTMIHVDAIQKQYPAAIARGLEILQQLGIKLAPKPDRGKLLRELAHTSLTLWGKSNERLLGLPTITDPTKLAQLQILDLLQAPAFFCDQALMALLSLVGVRLTVRDGNTPWAAGFMPHIALSALVWGHCGRLIGWGNWPISSPIDLPISRFRRG